MNYLEVNENYNAGLLRLLETNRIGTPGESMVYQHTCVQEKLDHITSLSFLSVALNSSYIGTCCLCHRKIKIGAELHKASYIRYFTFKSAYRVSKAKKDEKRVKSNGIKNEIHQYFESHLAQKNPDIYYAYVDPQNKRSVQLCEEFGFTEVRRFSANIFSRIRPKKILAIDRLEKEEHSKMQLLLNDFYSDYNFYQDDNTFFTESYYVLKDDSGEIVVGMHARKEKWDIIDLPGLTGKLIKYCLPLIPCFNKLFDADFEFLAVEGIYVKGNNVQLLQPFLETLLHDLNLYKALLFSDVDSPLRNHLETIDMGLLQKLSSQVETSVIVKTPDLESDLLNELRAKPAYISTFDIT